MGTPAQIAAGPRTPAGKAASSRNALRHGPRARAAVVPGEDPADLQRFRAEPVAALAPRDGREEWLAEAAAEAPEYRGAKAARSKPSFLRKGTQFGCLCASGILPIRPSGLAFAEKRLIFVEKHPKAPSSQKKFLRMRLDLASVGGAATRGAASPSADPALMRQD